MSSKVVHVRGLLKAVSSSRVQYKPYGYELDFSEGERSVLVEIDIPRDCVIEESESEIVISLDGLNAILEATAESVDKIQRAYEKRIASR